MSILKRGLKGAPVKRLQEKLGISADGDFGPGTERAVKEFQEANGLAVDGIAGPDTFSAMGLHELVLLRKARAARPLNACRKGWASALMGYSGRAQKPPSKRSNRRTAWMPMDWPGRKRLQSLTVLRR